jgi:hypothetical protein
MPDSSKDQSNKVQVWFKRGYNHNIKVQFVGDPLPRTQVDPILALSGSWQIGKEDVQTERGNNSTLKLAIISTLVTYFNSGHYTKLAVFQFAYSGHCLNKQS